MEKLFLGDQSPLNGGLLRSQAAQESGRFESIRYLLQDADTPWRETGQPDARLVNRWADYWAVAARMPWALSVPSTELTDHLGSVRSPRGLWHIAGPRTKRTLWGSREDQQLQEMLECLVQEEATWLRRLCDYAGRPAQSVNVADFGVGQSITEFFRDSPPQLIGHLPSEHFWAINEQGLRSKWDGQQRPGQALVPTGVALPLELATRGWWIGCTALGYLTRSLELRDRYVPGCKVSVCVISFDWRPSFDPIEVLQNTYRTKRHTAGKPVREMDPAALEKITEHWRGRPTTLGYEMLGGSLNPTLDFHCL